MKRTDAQKVDFAIAALWERFRPTTERRLQTLQAAVRCAKQGELDAETRQLAAGEAHRMAGSAGSYGFARVTMLARELELALQGEDELSVNDAARLNVLVDELAIELGKKRRPKASR